MSDEQLQQCLSFWQEKLGLKDWRISVRLVDGEEIDDIGDCKVYREDRLALIRIQHPESVSGKTGWHKSFPDLFNAEKTLVHELLHIHFDGLMEQDAEDHERVAQEQAINSITNALYSLTQ